MEGAIYITSPKGNISMAQKQNIYETTFIVNAGLDDPQIDAVIEKVRELIVKNNGEIVELVKWGRKRFAFPIKKKNNGFYVLCMFKSAGDLVARLERHYILDENIIRFLIIAMDKKAMQARISGNDLLKAAVTATPSTSGSPLIAETPIDDPLDVADPLTQTEA
jgi:small subunit ribosomal protein S6